MASGGHRQWSVAEFERDRPHLCDFLKNGPIRAIESGKRRILIRAPVKSGKRQMVEYLAMRDNTVHPTRKHIFLTQWHRKADENQRAELKCYGIDVFSGINNKKKEDYNAKIHQTLISDPRITLIIHIDECDHGSGIRQALAQIWTKWRDDTRIIFILYSATPEEVIYSGEIGDENEADEEMMEEFGQGVRFDYIPLPTFCGPARFLDEGLVFESRPFFEKVPGTPAVRLSEQAKNITADLQNEIQRNRRRNVLLLRLSYGDNDTEKPTAKENKAIYQFLKNIDMFPELSGFAIYVDKDEEPSGNDRITALKIPWSRENDFKKLITTEDPVIIVYDQTFSRSTELACHDRIFATHDYRNQITFSISSQAVERMNHYSTKYEDSETKKYVPSGFQPVRIYCHRKTLLLSAGRISYEAFLYNEWEMKRVSERRQRRLGNQDQQQQPPMFLIQKSDSTREIHPNYPDSMTEAEARAALIELGCEKRPSKLSARVAGDIDNTVQIDSRQVPCSSAAQFEQLAQDGQLNGNDGNRPRVNPFESYAPDPEDLDRRFKSNIRGVRKPRTVEEVLHENWGINERTRTRRSICYTEEGQCVILIQSFNGTQEVDNLTAVGSMYRPRILDTESSSSGDSE
jgi:hypothetical protein